MKVGDILMGKQISENLYLFEEEIKPCDLLKILRHLANQGHTLGSIYEKNRLFYNNSEKITRQEFEIIYEKQAKDINYWLDKYTREDFLSRLSSVMKIISSTTKEEIVNRIIKDKEILFNHFKKDFVERYSIKWFEFKRCKAFLPAESDETKKLAFCQSSKRKPLSGRNYLQYWSLSDSCQEIELTKYFKTEIIEDVLTINLKDGDEIILQNMDQYLKMIKKDTKFDVRPVNYNVKDTDLDIEDSISIDYSLSMAHLIGYFGIRKGSKFKTFCEGLKKRIDPETLKIFLNRKFLITTQSGDVYCGVEHDKELFEKLCWHLKIEFLREKRIICRVTEQETSETITALWEIINGQKCWYKFSFIEL